MPKRRRTGIADLLPIDRGHRFRTRLGEFGPSGEIPVTFKDVPATVYGGLPGEDVLVEIVRKYPDSIACRVVEVIEPSPRRVSAPCPYYGPCTGCQLQHVDYDHQLELKRHRVTQALAAEPMVAGVEVRPTLPSPATFRYRNHARFTVGKLGEVGFVNRHSRSFNRVDECLLMQDPINEVLAKVQGKVRGMTQMSVRASTGTGSVLVQPRLINPWLGVESGGAAYEEKLGYRTFRVAGSSFFQVNTAMAEKMIDIVSDILGLAGKETVVDAYAGVGVFAAMLAPAAGRVIGIEDSAAAVEDARHNSSDLMNVEFLQGRTEEALGTLEGIEAVVMDPPRAGCQPEAIAALKALAPERIAMVSCEPEALARDLARLCGDGAYVVEYVQPADMFPQTYHVEAVAAVRKKG